MEHHYFNLKEKTDLRGEAAQLWEKLKAKQACSESENSYDNLKVFPWTHENAWLIVFVKKERTVGNQGASHIPTNSSLQKFLNHLIITHWVLE